ncbi:MAG: homoserine dehydrogenase [Gammaproteobacteria bacterium]|nr:homoserine dehydrogenase [Gammaproteobacteria bacterium]
MKAVNVGLLGLGTVGGGTLAVLHRNADEISRRAGREIRVAAAAVRDPAKRRPVDTGGLRLTTDPRDIVDDPGVDIVVELIGGDGAARQAVLRAIDNGKHLVTANKALIALHGNTIFEKAQQRGVMVAFEAAVAGGIPIIKLIREGLAANRIEYLAGIINGTCNYILTRMQEAGDGFDRVLREAQDLGYAEADPAFDIEGTDAAHKLTILASIAFGIPLQFERVHVQGITAVGAEDIAYARELGYRIKHLGLARRTADGIELRVHPTLIPERRLIASVGGVMNAILVRADALGPTLYYGAGAGAEPTASSVVADLVDVVRAITTDPENRVPHLAFQPGSLAALPLLSIEQVETAYYLRLTVVNRPGVLAAITRIFGDSDISIDTILQKGRGRPNENVTVIMLTQETRERNMNAATAALGKLDTVTGEIARIRLERLP